MRVYVNSLCVVVLLGVAVCRSVKEYTEQIGSHGSLSNSGFAAQSWKQGDDRYEIIHADIEMENK